MEHQCRILKTHLGCAYLDTIPYSPLRVPGVAIVAAPRWPNPLPNGLTEMSSSEEDSDCYVSASEEPYEEPPPTKGKSPCNEEDSNLCVSASTKTPTRRLVGWKLSSPFVTITASFIHAYIHNIGGYETLVVSHMNFSTQEV